ncbi:MAG: RNA polymerase sigma factor [Planctomycetota bacterium]
MRRIPLDVPAGIERTAPPDPEVLSLQLVRSLPRLRRHAARRVGPERADDLVQETLVRALQSTDSFDETQPAWPWLRAIADRVALRSAERDARRPESTDGIDEFGAYDPQRGLGDSREEAAALLRRLRGPERDALERHYIGGESVAAIADATGAAVGTVKARLSRGRRRLLLLVGGAAGLLAAALTMVPRGSTPRPPRILHASIDFEVNSPAPPRFERVVLETVPTDGWRIEGARLADSSSPDADASRPESR